MIEGWLAGAADRFWSAVGGAIPFPREVEPVVGMGFPVSCKSLPELSVSAVERWMGQRRMPFRSLCGDRSLCGCLIGFRGKGIIFSCSDDPPAERRFTVAHETAHFLLDYFEPRQQALDALGPGIIPVLDGERSPTFEETIDALLGRVKLGLYMDMMPRAADGGIDQTYILRAEERADRLALELLAPRETVLAMAAGFGAVSRPEHLRLTVAALTGTFGLPRAIADRYARLLFRHRSRPSVAEWLRA